MPKARSKTGEYAILGGAGLLAIYLLTIKTSDGKGGGETIVEKITRDVLTNVTSRTGEFVQGAASGVIDTGRSVIGGKDESNNPTGLLGGIAAPTWFLGNPFGLAAPGTKKGVTVAPPPSSVQDVYAAGGSSQDYVNYASNYLKKQNSTTDVVKGNLFGSSIQTVRTGSGFFLPPSQAAAFKDPVGDAQFAEYLATAKKQPAKKKLFPGILGNYL